MITNLLNISTRIIPSNASILFLFLLFCPFFHERTSRIRGDLLGPSGAGSIYSHVNFIVCSKVYVYVTIHLSRLSRSQPTINGLRPVLTPANLMQRSARHYLSSFIARLGTWTPMLWITLFASTMKVLWRRPDMGVLRDLRSSTTGFLLPRLIYAQRWVFQRFSPKVLAILIMNHARRCTLLTIFREMR